MLKQRHATTLKAQLTTQAYGWIVLQVWKSAKHSGFKTYHLIYICLCVKATWRFNSITSNRFYLEHEHQQFLNTFLNNKKIKRIQNRKEREREVFSSRDYIYVGMYLFYCCQFINGHHFCYCPKIIWETFYGTSPLMMLLVLINMPLRH